MPVKATKQLQQALAINTKTVHLILWIRHHWIAATVNTPNATMQIMDSAPGIATQEDIRSIADFIGDALHTPLTTTYLRVPRQPTHSNECGAHAVINLLLSQQEWLWEREESDKLIQRVSYEELARLLRLCIKPHSTYVGRVTVRPNHSFEIAPPRRRIGEHAN